MICKSLVNWVMIHYLVRVQSTMTRYLIIQKKYPCNVPDDLKKNPKQKSNVQANQYYRENILNG